MAKKEKKIRTMMTLKTPLNEAEKILLHQVEKGHIMLDIQIKSNVEIKTADKLYNHWNSKSYDILKKIFKSSNVARDYSSYTWSIGGILICDLKLIEKKEKLHSNIRKKISKLESIITSLHLLEEGKKAKTKLQKIFFVHGTDCDTSAQVLNLLVELNLQPIIMKDLALAGKTIIDEIQKRAEVNYAIGLLTPDNLGGNNAKDLQYRADQNVILELGIFIGKLGRKRVCSLHVEGVELPDDFHGFEYIEIDSTNVWKKKLINELHLAGFGEKS